MTHAAIDAQKSIPPLRGRLKTRFTARCEQSVLFRAGEGGYFTFRIPAGHGGDGARHSPGLRREPGARSQRAGPNSGVKLPVPQRAFSPNEPRPRPQSLHIDRLELTHRGPHTLAPDPQRRHPSGQSLRTFRR